MSALDDLIQEIADEDLRRRIKKEIATLKGTKKFGLVFEPQNPECTPLYDVPVKKKSLVALKAGKLDDLYRVTKIIGDEISCVRVADGKEITFNKDDLISVAQFGEAIYPYLQPLDTVCNAPDSSLWHALIEADNYHALQLLKYLYGGKVDCIYIDPPYNTGARDWKYNNDYVDASNEYRHSKWLSMMERRLKLAKELLNPRDSVLIVTIDEHEYLHLGCLLEEIFRGANIQMITTIIKPEGTARFNEFSRTNEFIFFIMIGNAQLSPTKSNMFELQDEEEDIPSDTLRSIEWRSLRRRERTSVRSARPNQFYPIFVNKSTGLINSIGEALSLTENRVDVTAPDNCYALFPLRPDGTETLWGKHFETARDLLAKGYLKISNGNNPKKAVVNYLPSGIVDDIENGKVTITGRGMQNEVIGVYNETKLMMPKTVWNLASHNAQTHGSLILKKFIGNRFSFPKSLYAVHDALKFFVANKSNALIVDFFAGSGTTLHAVNLLNAEDGGNRRCILVTNNEVSDAEEKSLRRSGYTPADNEWQRLGVARYVTWPRTVCSIEGHDINGAPLNGNYLGSDLPMADGFKANAAFFKLGFLDKDYVALGRQFKELLPVLWFKAGCHGKCPTIDEKNLPPMLILPENNFAVLLDEKFFSDFERKIFDCAAIDTIFIITDSDYGYHAMIKNFADKATYQLYRNYLENFKISG